MKLDGGGSSISAVPSYVILVRHDPLAPALPELLGPARGQGGALVLLTLRVRGCERLSLPSQPQWLGLCLSDRTQRARMPTLGLWE